MGEIRSKIEDLESEVDSFKGSATGPLANIRTEITNMCTGLLAPIKGLLPIIQTAFSELSGKLGELESQANDVTP